VALLSRLHPTWFPDDGVAKLLPGAESRLRYPLDYWNGLAALIVIGLPLVIWMASSARSVAVRAVGAALLPALVLTAFFTLSRGGALELAVALVVLIAIHPRRRRLLPLLALTGLGSALLIAAAEQRHAILDGVATQAAQEQGDEMLAIVLVVCIGIGLLQAAISLAARYELGPRFQIHIPRRPAMVATLLALVIAISIAVAAGLPGELSDKWDEFKTPGVASGPTAARFESASGNGRYQYWQASLDAFSTKPLTGIGPGTFEFWWAREGSLPGFVRDAHSVYLETLAETGIFGLLLLGGMIALILISAVTRTLRAGSKQRELLAAVTAACAAFAVAAAVDWVWELAVIPVAFLILGAAMLSESDDTASRRPARIAPRLLLSAVAIAALVAIAMPLAGATSVKASQNSVNDGRLSKALEDAEDAKRAQPYAATPSLQEALVFELTGDFDAAVSAARQATQDEPTNWRTWLALSRLEARSGDADGSIAAYRKARELNPRSPLFSQ
jgi:O-antigen ligase